MAKKKRVVADAVALRSMESGRQHAKRLLEARKRAALERPWASLARAEALGVKRSEVKAWAAAMATKEATLVAEGDSWFDYPFHDVLRVLDDKYGYDVHSEARKGDALEEMAYNGGQLDAFTRRIEKLVMKQQRPKAILLSGGGNDIAGDEFHMLLNHAASAVRGFSDAVIRGIIDERIRAAYVHILTAITVLCEKQTGGKLPILVHGYDYPVPDGRGFFGGFWVLPGPWLRPGFRRKGYSDLDECTEMMTVVMDRFSEMLKAVTLLPGFEHVRFVDLRGVLSNGPSYKKWWDNELHPTKKGYEAVAREFVKAIEGT